MSKLKYVKKSLEHKDSDNRIIGENSSPYTEFVVNERLPDVCLPLRYHGDRVSRSAVFFGMN